MNEVYLNEDGIFVGNSFIDALTIRTWVRDHAPRNVLQSIDVAVAAGHDRLDAEEARPLPIVQALHALHLLEHGR